MTDPHAPGSAPYPVTPPVAGYGPPPSVALTASGFAGTMLIIVSLFQILQGIAAIAADDVYVTGIEYTYRLDLTTWGWVHIIVGALALAAGIGVLARQAWAYMLGTFLAFVATVANFAFLPYYPIWSVVILAFNVGVIWSLCTLLAQDDAG